MLRQIHVSHNVRSHRSRAVGQPRATEAGMEFLGDGAAADGRPAFQNERVKSSLGEIESCDQPIVSGAEDHDFACLRHD